MDSSSPLNADLPPAALQMPVAAKPLGPYQCFPTQLLPMPLNGFVHEAAQTLDGDPALVALPLLAEVAAAIGNARLIRLKRSWREPAFCLADHRPSGNPAGTGGDRFGLFSEKEPVAVAT